MLTLKRFVPPILPKMTGDWEKDGPNVIKAFNDVLNSVNNFLLSLEEKGSLAIDQAAIDGTVIGGASAAAGTFTDLTSTGNTVLGNASTDTLNVGNGGIIKDSSGRVGIGVTPSYKLDVYGANVISAIRASSGFGLQLINGATGSFAAVAFQINNTETARISSSADNIIFGTGSAATTRATLNSTGLGIGVTPSYALHVNSGQIAAPDGSAAAPAYTFASSGNSDTGAYLSAADTYSIACGGVLVASFVQGTGLTAYSSIELLSGSANGRVKIRSSAHSTSPGTLELQPSSGGSVWAGVQSATSTSATDGFLYIPTCAGTPTGTPTTASGLAPLIVDTTNHKLYFYSGGSWRDAGP